MSVLVPCPSCSRHVRAAERACPFCAAALPADLGAHAVPAATRRLDRLAVFTFAASIAAAGCGGKTETPDVDQVDGGSSSGSSGSSSSSGSSGTSSGVAPPYGLPGPEDDGGAAALYGLPAPDGGPPGSSSGSSGSSSGNPAPLYGAPP